MDTSFEFPLDLERHLHETLLINAPAEARTRFRAGVYRKTRSAVDVAAGERTKKKIARAISVLRDEYAVPEDALREALAYTNTWEDALAYLALSNCSDELPAKLRAKPAIEDKRDEKGEDSGTLEVVKAPVEEAADLQAQTSSWSAATEPMENWDDEADAEETGEEVKAPTVEAVASEPSPPTASQPEEKEHVEEAMTWTQRYLLQLAQEEEREKEEKKQEAAMSPEERELRDLEAQYTAMNERLRNKTDDGKLTKKKQKALSQDLQALRFQLIQRGWNEAEYRKRMQPAPLAVPVATKPAEDEKPDDDQLFYVRDGRQSRLGFRDDDEAGNGGGSDEENYSGGLFDQPSAPQQQSVPAVADDTKISGGNAPVLASFSASLGSWTGKTPRDLLQDHCQKQKYQRPQYKKLSSKGSHLYSITLEKKGAARQEFSAAAELFPVSHGFRSIDEAKDAVATVALYALTPHLPLYGLMPPPFRALWQSWEKEKQARATASVDAVKNAFDTLVDEIFHSIPVEIAAKTVEESSAKPAVGTSKQQADVTLDSWDVDDWDDDLPDEQPLPKPGQANEAAPPIAREAEDNVEDHASKQLRDMFTRNTATTQYKQLYERRVQLPIASFKDQVLHALDNHDVILISGETGCGKSTQVPQYLLEEMIAARCQGSRCQIVCTQPRRLAAISLAERVSLELGEKAMAQGDSLCGFQIRLENRVTKHTKLLFCTTGILLRKLQDAATLGEELSHIIVDEVHERDVQNDVLLSMLRTFLETSNKTRRHPLKVILMSATLNAASFQQYFGGDAVCPMLTVPGRTFPVEEYYLEDALEATSFVVDEQAPWYRAPDVSTATQSASVTISGRGGKSSTQRVTWSEASVRGSSQSSRSTDGSSPYSHRTLLALDRLDASVINYDLIEQLIEHLASHSDVLRLDDSQRPSAAVLVFLPGLQEISNLLDVLGGNRLLRDSRRFQLLPLHSSLSPEDQRRIFDMPRGIVRIIAATNIAETSLTIEDVKVVVDTGRAKEMRHDSATKTNLLEEIWVSQANAKQRLGRAGRTSGGVCYRLFSRDTFDHDMREQPLPEIKRAPLTSLCLQIKTFGVETTCADFLRGCLDPPDRGSVDDALRELYEIGALQLDDGQSSESLTVLGSHLAKLPVDVRVGKLLLLGAMFGQFDAVSTCAAILETKSPFVAPYGYQKEMQAARQLFAVASSDLLTDANAFNAWRDRFRHGHHHRRQHETQFCRQYFLSRRSLAEITKLKNQFASLVAQMGFIDGSRTQEQPLTPASCVLVAALLYGGLEPNVMYVDPVLSTANRATLRSESERNGVSKAFIHPGSINAKTTSFASPFLTYAVKLHTSQVYLPSCSMVLPVALAVFSFAFQIVFPHRAVDNGDVTVKLNEWVALSSSLRSAVLLQELRSLVRAFVDDRIQSPPYKKSKDSSNECTATVDTITTTLATVLARELQARDTKQQLTKQVNPALQA